MIYTQLQLFFIFLINGVIIALLFDFFRILRKAIKTADFVTYIEDVLFWIFTGLIILYSIFTYNNGEIRLFMFLAIILGVLIYLIFISKLILKISLGVINTLKKFFRIIFNIVKIPFAFLMNLIKKLFFNPITFIIINIKNYFSSYKLKNKNKLKYIYHICKKRKIPNKFVKNAKN